MSDPITDKTAAEAFTAEHKRRHGYSFHEPPVVGKVLPAHYPRGGCKRCWGEVTDNSNSMITHWSQCDKVGKIELADGSTWCGIHCPEAVNKRADARAARWAANEARYKARRDADLAASQIKAAFPRFLAALRAIEAGDNDPRTTARVALGDFLEPKETT